MNRRDHIAPADLKKLESEIKLLPEGYKKQVRDSDIEDIYYSVEIFKRDFLILNWLHLYVGSRGEKVKKVVGELYRLYPKFKIDIKDQGRDYPDDGKRLRFEDEELFQSWLRDNSSYPGKKWGAIAWMGFRSEEINCFSVWKKHQKYQPNGFEYISFPIWYEGLKCSPRKILTEVNISPEDFEIVSKGLPSVAQVFADQKGRVAVVPADSLDINTERFLKAGEVAKLLQRPVKTIYNWASEGIIPCYRDGGSLRFKWDEVKEWYAQYRQKGRTSRQFK